MFARQACDSGLPGHEPLSQNCSARSIASQAYRFEVRMSTQLVANATRNRGAWHGDTVWDRIVAAWFRRFVYTQIWEDPEADLAALQLPLGSTIVTMSS